MIMGRDLVIHSKESFCFGVKQHLIRSVKDSWSITLMELFWLEWLMHFLKQSLTWFLTNSGFLQTTFIITFFSLKTTMINDFGLSIQLLLRLSCQESTLVLLTYLEFILSTRIICFLEESSLRTQVRCTLLNLIKRLSQMQIVLVLLYLQTME